MGAAEPNAVAPFAGWDYQTPQDVMAEINALTPSYAGVAYQQLEAGARLQWPSTRRGASRNANPARTQQNSPRGLGRFAAVDHVPPGERPDDEYPMVMTTGHVLYHWHGGEMTRRASGLLAVYPEALVEVSVEDAQRLGVANGDMVRLVSRHAAQWRPKPGSPTTLQPRPWSSPPSTSLTRPPTG